MAHVLYYNRVKFPKDFFSIVLCANMVAVSPYIISAMLIGGRKQKIPH